MIVKAFHRMRSSVLSPGPFGIIAMVALLVTTAIGFIVLLIQEQYFQNHPLPFDHVAYVLRYATLYTQTVSEPAWSVAWREWGGHIRGPGLFAPLVLFAPELLSHRFGYLVLFLPIFFFFLLLLGWFVYRRTKSTPYAILCIVFFSAFPGLYLPAFGLGAFWLDLPVSYLVASAGICLLLSEMGRNLRWLAAFAIFSGFAIVSRFVSVFYLVGMLGPIFLYYLVRMGISDKSANPSLRAFTLVGAIVALIAAYPALKLMPSLVEWHLSVGAVHHGLEATFYEFVIKLGRYTDGWGLPVVLGGVLLINLMFLGDWKRWKEQGGLLWLGISFPLLLLFVIQSAAHEQVALYAVPTAFLLCVTPLPWRRNLDWRLSRMILTKMILASFVIFIGITIGAYKTWISTEKELFSPHPYFPEAKKLSLELGKAIGDQGDRIVWNGYFGQFAGQVSMESFYATGNLPLFAGEDEFFHDKIHPMDMWKYTFPDMTPRQVAEDVYKRTGKLVDVAVVYADPNNIKPKYQSLELIGEYTREVARYMAKTIAADPRWKKIFVLEDTIYGPLAGYRNLNPDNKGFYEQRLYR